MRKVVVLAVTAASLLAASSASAAPAGGGCVLSGTAYFDGSGLLATSGLSTYTFDGTLSNCQSNEAGAPTGGVVFAGEGPGGVSLPRPSGSGGCARSTTQGIAVIRWNNGDTTVTSYKTEGALAAVALTGSVIPSVSGTDGNGNTVTYTTNRYVGSSVGGPLTFTTMEPQLCNSGGLRSAAINGVQVLGHS